MPNASGTASDQGQNRGHDGAEDRHGGAIDVLHRVPVVRDQEAEPEGPECREPAEEQHHDDGAQQEEHEQAGSPCRQGENSIAEV